MPIEAEVKVKISREDPILKNLRRLRLVRTYREEDTYLEDPLGLIRGRGVLKLRRRNGRASLILKGRALRSKYKAREEVEIGVGNGKLMEEVLLKLGFKPSLKVEKVRTEYLLPYGRVFLDRVKGLGTFIEVEVLGGNLSEAELRLSKIIEELGLSDRTLIRDSYPQMLRRVRGGTEP